MSDIVEINKDPDPALLRSMAMCIRKDFWLLGPEQQQDIIERSIKCYDEITGKGSYSVGSRDRYLTAKEQELEDKISALQRLCTKAAEELTDHWEAHCGKDGYGPLNLLYRLQGKLEQDGY